MTKALVVYFNEKKCGDLIQDQHGELNFTYSPEWLTNPQAIAISCSLPLQKETFTRKQCQAFFEGILPEQQQRKIIAKNLGISDKNDFSMLEKIGGECAGALSFIPAKTDFEPKNFHYREVTENQLLKIIQELPNKPLLAGERGIRLSLAGVQDKLALAIKNEKFFVPLNNAPSTHILKPDNTRYEEIIFNEYFCLTLANQIGLSAAEVEMKKLKSISFLLVKRYDRLISSYEKDDAITRLHQEDFCQALNVPSIKKYQNEEGPSLKQSFQLIRDKSSMPVIDLQKMLDAVIFNFLIGNCDAHGKNFSLLYVNEQIKLAPLYDLVCTLYYPEIDKKMAMKIGGEYDIRKIRPRHFDKLADEIGFSKPEVQRRVVLLCEKILNGIHKIPHQYPAQQKIADLVAKRCTTFMTYQ